MAELKPLSTQDLRDLGFGSVVSSRSRKRLLNKDGSFNVERKGLGFWSSLSLYQALVTMTWSHFFLLIIGAFLFINILFAVAYLLCGPEALTGQEYLGPFWRAFFFSVETSGTVGYGVIAPVTFAANIIVTIEVLVSLLSLALASGLLFARVSRPTARILFSHYGVIAPYQSIQAFEFRIVNLRKSQIIELEAKVLFSRFEQLDGNIVRRYYPLKLERHRVVFFPLSWTIVHPIDEESPLYQVSLEELEATNAEFLVLLTGIDETFSQTVHARSSYKIEEIFWNAKFRDLFIFPDDDRPLRIDIDRFHEIERLV